MGDVLDHLNTAMAEQQIRRAAGLTATCPRPCDDDCDADCHEGHDVPAKRHHQPTECPGRHL